MSIKEKDLVKAVLTSLPLEESGLPKEFTEIPPEKIYEIIQEETTEGPVQYQVKHGKYLFSDVLTELNKLRGDFGGSAGFFRKNAEINELDANRTIFGVPLSAVKDWLRMTLDKNWQPKFFWHFLAKLFHVTPQNFSKYDDIHLRIQRFGLLIANKDYIESILDKNDTSKFSDFAAITGLAWHPKQNSSGAEKMYIQLVEQFLTVYFEKAKAKGRQALIQYFNAFQGVCFEDRARALEEYVRKNSLFEDSPEKNVNFIADWSNHDPIEVVYVKEAQAYALTYGHAATAKQLFDQIVKKDFFTTEFSNAAGEKYIPSKEGFYSWAKEQVEWGILAEDEPGPSP